MASQPLVVAVHPDNQRTEAEYRIQRLFRKTQHHRRSGHQNVLVATSDLEALIVSVAVKNTLSDDAIPSALAAKPASQLTDRDIGVLTDDAIYAIASLVQIRIGQNHGGVAGLHFSDDFERAQVEAVIRRYLQVEVIHEDDNKTFEVANCDEVVA